MLSMLGNAEQFGRAFVQLAFGYRLLRLGVDGLEFEPPTDGGRRANCIMRGPPIWNRGLSSPGICDGLRPFASIEVAVPNDGTGMARTELE